MQFFDKREPKSLAGEVWVDAQTSVVLKARLDGRLEVNGSDGPTGMRAQLDLAVTEIGKEQTVEAPKDFLLDQDKPLGIAAALDKFGIPHGGKAADAGLAEEPEEDTSSDEETAPAALPSTSPGTAKPPAKR
jgi:hypothetical protein